MFNFKIPGLDQIFARRKHLLYSLVFNTTEGRRVLEDLSAFAYVDTTTFDPNPQVQARNEGRRQVVLYILEALNIKIDNIGDNPNGSTVPTDEYSIHSGPGPNE